MEICYKTINWVTFLVSMKWFFAYDWHNFAYDWYKVDCFYLHYWQTFRYDWYKITVFVYVIDKLLLDFDMFCWLRTQAFKTYAMFIFNWPKNFPIQVRNTYDP